MTITTEGFKEVISELLAEYSKYVDTERAKNRDLYEEKAEFGFWLEDFLTWAEASKGI